MSRFLVEKYQGMESYTPGEQPKPGEFLKLNTNESPFPPPSQTGEAVAKAASQLHIYNDTQCKALTNAFCKVYGVQPEQVIFGNGSDEILAFCFQAFCDKSVAYPNISYGFYPVFAELYGLEAEEIPLREDFSIAPVDYFGKQKTIVIANPNAPTSMALSAREICSILDQNPDQIVVVDEAYVDFGGESMVPYVNQYENLVVSGTFSKCRSMAGARLGYAIANPALIADLNKIKYSYNPYNVNTMTQVAGTISLEQDEYYRDCVAQVVLAREYFVEELNRLGFETLPAKANFVFTRHPKLTGDQLYGGLREKKILVRHFTRPEICEFVRISIGTKEQMTQVVTALSQLLEVAYA